MFHIHIYVYIHISICMYAIENQRKYKILLTSKRRRVEILSTHSFIAISYAHTLHIQVCSHVTLCPNRLQLVNAQHMSARFLPLASFVCACVFGYRPCYIWFYIYFLDKHLRVCNSHRKLLFFLHYYTPFVT